MAVGYIEVPVKLFCLRVRVNVVTQSTKLHRSYHEVAPGLRDEARLLYHEVTRVTIAVAKQAA